MWKRSSEWLYGGKDGPNRLPSASLIKRNKASNVLCSGPELLQERRLTEAECSSALSSDMTDQFLTFQTLCSPKKLQYINWTAKAAELWEQTLLSRLRNLRLHKSKAPCSGFFLGGGACKWFINPNTGSPCHSSEHDKLAMKSDSQHHLVLNISHSSTSQSSECFFGRVNHRGSRSSVLHRCAVLVGLGF